MTMLDRWTDAFFWPALIGSWAGMLVALAAALMPKTFEVAVQPLTFGLGALLILMFVVALFDPPTQRAVLRFNDGWSSKWRELSWRDRIFSAESGILGRQFGDRRLLIVNRLVWLLFVMFMVLGRQDLQLLSAVSFALSTLMLMLIMKRLPAPKA